MLSTLLEETLAYKPPRACFLDYPLGCPVGRPGEPENQRAILRSAFELDRFEGDEWSVRTLPFEWAEDGSRDWEETVRDIYRRSWGIVSSHVTAHKGTRVPLAGREEEFTIRCDC